MSREHIHRGRHPHVVPVERAARVHRLFVGRAAVHGHPLRAVEPAGPAGAVLAGPSAQVREHRVLRPLRHCWHADARLQNPLGREILAAQSVAGGRPPAAAR